MLADIRLAFRMESALRLGTGNAFERVEIELMKLPLLRGCLIVQFLSDTRLKSALNSFAHLDDPSGSPRIANRIYVSISDFVSSERIIKQPLSSTLLDFR